MLCKEIITGHTVHQISHTGEKPLFYSLGVGNSYSCSECGKCLWHTSLLFRYKRSQTGEKPYLCDECGKCFGRKSNFVMHKKSHTGEKPYSCSEWGGAGKKRCLQNLETKRPDVSTVACSLTMPRGHLGHPRIDPLHVPLIFGASNTPGGKCVGIKAYFVIHERAHTDEKPYSCAECEKCFVSKSALVVHKRSHTSEKPCSCAEGGGKCFLLKSQLSFHTREMFH
ncbi:gastrula zinc finger protein XlCGF17.1-like [Hyperolius riggenbachi]|uniref:gastrula zinc finger protein XlCGF17.1-like n=1 Tax=Hyperolius riggenbachi TaxID=752182 RepID=UPI0035A394BB